MLTRMLVAALVFLTPALAHAGCFNYSYYNGYYQPYYQPVYYPVVEKHVTVLDYYPVFQVGYLPPSAVTTTTTTQTVQAAQVRVADPAPTCEQKLSTLTKKFSDLEAKINLLLPPEPEIKAAPRQENKAQAPAKNSVLLSTCAACHDRSTASAKGGNLTLSDSGKYVALSPDQIGKVLKAVTTGKMPKNGNKLTDSEFNSVMQELIDLSAK